MIRITQKKIDANTLRDFVASPRCGAVVTFEGVVRDHDHGQQVLSVTYEAYVEMAEKEMAKILEMANVQWPGIRLAVEHRVGCLVVGEVSVAVAAASPHRKEAFEAARFVIDRIKELVPIWKKQEAEGGSGWKLRC
jgi:molybdopterin synthase catalytic subunit